MRLRWLSKPQSPPFRFLEPGRLVDRELELVSPGTDLIEAVMRACLHPVTVRDQPDAAMTGKVDLMRQLSLWPEGHQSPDAAQGTVPTYHFWMRIDGGIGPPVVAGGLGLRIATGPEIELYYGHVGYHVYPPHRGHGYAERSVRLLLPLARSHGLNPLWITTNPDNHASRRTCERLGAQYIETVAVPKKHVLHKRGDHQKCRYRIEVG